MAYMKGRGVKGRGVGPILVPAGCQVPFCILLFGCCSHYRLSSCFYYVSLGLLTFSFTVIAFVIVIIVIDVI